MLKFFLYISIMGTILGIAIWNVGAFFLSPKDFCLPELIIALVIFIFMCISLQVENMKSKPRKYTKYQKGNN